MAAREMASTVETLEKKLTDRLARSLKGEKVCRLSYGQMRRRVKQALREPKVKPAGGPAPAPAVPEAAPVPGLLL